MICRSFKRLFIEMCSNTSGKSKNFRMQRILSTPHCCLLFLQKTVKKNSTISIISKSTTFSKRKQIFIFQTRQTYCVTKFEMRQSQNSLYYDIIFIYTEKVENKAKEANYSMQMYIIHIFMLFFLYFHGKKASRRRRGEETNLLI